MGLISTILATPVVEGTQETFTTTTQTLTEPIATEGDAFDLTGDEGFVEQTGDALDQTLDGILGGLLGGGSDEGGSGGQAPDPGSSVGQPGTGLEAPEPGPPDGPYDDFGGISGRELLELLLDMRDRVGASLERLGLSQGQIGRFLARLDALEQQLGALADRSVDVDASDIPELELGSIKGRDISGLIRAPGDPAAELLLQQGLFAALERGRFGGVGNGALREAFGLGSGDLNDGRAAILRAMASGESLGRLGAPITVSSGRYLGRYFA